MTKYAENTLFSFPHLPTCMRDVPVKLREESTGGTFTNKKERALYSRCGFILLSKIAGPQLIRFFNPDGVIQHADQRAL